MNNCLQRLLAVAFTMISIGASNAAPSLLDAAKSGSKDAIRTLIAGKADVNATEADGSTALLWVAYHDDVESADALLKAGAKPNTANDLGATPLWAASQNGSSAMARSLLAAGADPNAPLLAGETPLMVAARGGYPEVLEQLIAKGAKVDATGTREQTALMWAASQKHPAAVRVLLDHGANLSMKSAVYYEVMAIPPHGFLPYNRPIPHGGETALMFAARSGDVETVKLLVAKGANVNDTDAWGVSAMTLAEHSGYADVVEFLLEKKANPNFMLAGFSPLHEAVMRRDERVVKALLDHGAYPDDQLRTWTPTRRSSDDWNFNASHVGVTPLWLAASLGEPKIMRMLIDKGANPKFVHHAAYVAEAGFGQAERDEIFSTLMAATGMLRTNAWVDPPRDGREAATLEAVKLLVEAGVDLNIKGTDGKTALDGARTQRYQSVIAYLVEKGAQGAAPAQGGGGGRGGPRPAPSK